MILKKCRRKGASRKVAKTQRKALSPGIKERPKKGHFTRNRKERKEHKGKL